jgi:hypothetical protein
MENTLETKTEKSPITNSAEKTGQEARAYYTLLPDPRRSVELHADLVRIIDADFFGGRYSRAR